MIGDDADPTEDEVAEEPDELDPVEVVDGAEPEVEDDSKSLAADSKPATDESKEKPKEKAAGDDKEKASKAAAIEKNDDPGALTYLGYALELDPANAEVRDAIEQISGVAPE